MKPIRWGVIGVGRFGAIHARVLAALPGVELAAVCRRDETLCRQAAAEFGAGEAFTDYRRLLASTEIESGVSLDIAHVISNSSPTSSSSPPFGAVTSTNTVLGM